MSDQALAARSALKMEGLTVRYGKTTALDGVTLSVAPGSVYALLGRNGAGKTSAVRCILGHRKADEGRAELLGRDAWLGRVEVMNRTGVVPEDPDSPPLMTAAQLVRFSERLYTRWDASSVRDRLKRFAVPGDVPFGRLSKGQKGMLTLALALGHTPDLLILDDPTLGLDAVARKAFFEELVGELAERSATVFITSHDLRGVEGVAQRVGLLREGRLLLDEGIEDLKDRFRRIRFTFRDSGEGAGPQEAVKLFTVLNESRLGAGVEMVVSDYREETFARFRSIPGVSEAEALALSLEDIFIALTGEAAGGAS